MKKNYLFLGAMALTGLFASCSQTETEELAGNQTEIGKRVTFTATVPAEFAQPKTRANDPANIVKRYIVEVWNSDATEILHRKETVSSSTDADKFSFDLENGTYQVLFWVDNIDATTTTITKSFTLNGKTIQFEHYDYDRYYKTSQCSPWQGEINTGLQLVVQNNLNAYSFVNNDYPDAFCHHEELVKEANTVDLKITLTRPLCKIILQQKNPTKETVTDLCKQIHIAKDNLPWGYIYNVYSGEIRAAQETSAKDFDLLPTAAADGNLLYFYSFAPKTPGTLSLEAKLSFTKVDGASKELQDLVIPANTIPLKQNYVIYVKGNIIKEVTTGPKTDFTISMKNEWTGNDETTDLDNP